MQQLKDFLLTVNDNSFFQFFKKHVLARIWQLLKYILKHPLRSIWWCVKMYIALVLFTLFLVFSFSANATVLDMSDLKEPETVSHWKCYIDGDVIDMYNDTSACGQMATTACKAKDPDFSSFLSSNSETYKAWSCKHSSNTTGYNGIAAAGKQPNPVPEPCQERDDEYKHTINGQGEAGFMCAKPKSNENPDSCPKSNSLNDAVFTNQAQICFNDDTTGTSCNYQSQDGIAYVPVEMKEYAVVNCETGEPDAMPDNPEPDEDGCYKGTYSAKMCPADPNDKCDVRTDIAEGESIYVCEENCGFYNDKFICAEDTGQDTIPDMTNPCDDALYAGANAKRCAADDGNPDKNNDGQVDNSDIIDQLGTLSGINNDILGGLGDLLNSTNKNTDELKEANKLAKKGNENTDGINAKLSEIIDSLNGDPANNPTLDTTIPDTLLHSKHDWNERNFYTVTADFVSGVKQSQIYSAVDNFFTVSFSGSCPVYSTTIDSFGTITLDQWCGETMNSIWPWIEAIILLAFSWLAVREFMQ